MTDLPRTLEGLAQLVIGRDALVPTIDGERPYINFDNAATTPALVPVRDAVDRFLAYASSIHRGTGFKSLLSTRVFEESRAVVSRFFGADRRTHTVIFTKNTTEAVNKLARRFPWRDGDAAMVSGLEHHSNDLPWRKHAPRVVRLPCDDHGFVDLQRVEDLLRTDGRVRLVAISGASNVVGSLSPVHELAALAHRYGARIFVDAAQLAPHRQVRMGPADAPDHLDYVAFSGHKMYAPYGAGALIGPTDMFAEGEPDQVGGGTVDIVTESSAFWTAPPDRDEAGTPNVAGAIALAQAIRCLEAVGLEAVAEHERELTSYALRRLAHVPGLSIYGETDPRIPRDRTAAIPLNLGSMPHALLAAALSWEGGIGVRSGCFCAHPFIKQVLHLSEADAHRLAERMQAHDRSEVPGLVRWSFGIYNTEAEVDRAVEVLHRIALEGPRADYALDARTGEYHPVGVEYDFDRYFHFD